MEPRQEALAQVPVQIIAERSDTLDRMGITKTDGVEDFLCAVGNLSPEPREECRGIRPYHAAISGLPRAPEAGREGYRVRVIEMYVGETGATVVVDYHLVQRTGEWEVVGVEGILVIE
jgi:hypothetical protein